MKAWLTGLIAATMMFSAQAADLTIEHGKVRASLPGVTNSAAFMTLHNSSDQPVRLVAVETGLAAVAELHTHKMLDGKMAMRQIDFIEVPASGQTELRPGGLHVMLIGLHAPLQEGEFAELTLVFDNGERVPLRAPIENIMRAMKH